MGRSDIFLIPTGRLCLLHAPVHGITAVLNGSAAVQLRHVLGSGDLSGAGAELRPLAGRLLDRPSLLPKAKEGRFAPSRLSLLLTNDCNLRCHYCSPACGDSARLTMSRELCSAAIGFFADIARREALPSLSIYYFGGEPFLPWGMVQFSIAEANRHADRLGVPLVATGTTNGFMPEDHAAWVADHFRFVVVSVDGPPDIHDLHRVTPAGGGSYDVVSRTLRIFEDRGLPFAIRSSIGRRAAPRMREIAEFLCRNFRPVAVNFEPLIASGRCSQHHLDPPDPDDFIRGVVEAEEVLGSYDVQLKLGMVGTRQVSRSNCGLTNDQCVVTPDGLVSACFAANERSSEHCERFAIGEYVDGSIRIDNARLRSVRSFGVENVRLCRDCFCKWHCSGGCRVFHTPSTSDDTLPPMCRITQKLSVWRLLKDMNFEEEANAFARSA